MTFGLDTKLILQAKSGLSDEIPQFILTLRAFRQARLFLYCFDVSGFVYMFVFSFLTRPYCFFVFVRFRVVLLVCVFGWIRIIWIG